MYGMKFVNERGVDIIEGDECAFSYWGSIRNQKLTRAKPIVLFDIPYSVPCVVFFRHTINFDSYWNGYPFIGGESNYPVMIGSYMESWNETIIDAYVFVPSKYIPKSSGEWGIEMFDSKGNETFNIRRPPLSYSGFYPYDVDDLSMPSFTSPGRVAVPLMYYSPEIWIEGGPAASWYYSFSSGRDPKGSGDRFGLVYDQSDFGVPENTGGTVPQGHFMTIDCDFYDKFANLPNWKQAYAMCEETN